MKYPDCFKIEERNYEGFTYHAAISRRDGMDIIYYRSKDEEGVIEEGLETYSGSNYIVGSTEKSYSRHYKIDSIPKTHKTTKFLLEQYLKQELGDRLIS